MKLLTYKDKHQEYTYYINPNGMKVYHGEYKDYHANGRVWEHSFYYRGELHGEYMLHMDGALLNHRFYIDGDPRPYTEMTEQEKLLFQIKYPGFRFIEE